MGLDLVGYGLGHEGLAATRRAVEQHPLGGRHTVPLVLCGELERVPEAARWGGLGLRGGEGVRDGERVSEGR